MKQKHAPLTPAAPGARPHPWIAGLRFGAFTWIGLVLGGCTVSKPFSRPANQERPTQADQQADSTLLVALTHAVLSEDREPFDRYTRMLVDEMEKQPGLYGYSVRKELLGDEVWTMTVWYDKASLERFIYSDIHQQAIQAAMPAVIATRFLRFEVPQDEAPPRWNDALERLSKVELTPMQ
jgi:quinol monooxygenase YgiN